ncbi:MAG: 16S rRNA (cytidine(1402)-2'-O)-methyltransferase [Candidatus Sericytochromatia bacterium]|nr:16S rRNA (cytidine(1402)-2'-O)-methyltransferase [Candidatus Sericytochromatia bacterium]
MPESIQPGTLYLVGTPIGNMGDMSPRAVAVLQGVALIAAEDTRHTRRLLEAHAIGSPLVSHHAHNERASSAGLVERLRAGDAIALVTDAGMPGISDPGEALVREAVAAGLPVVAVPGPTAFVTALVASGLPTDRFTFEGFLPREARPRRKRLQALASEPRTMVFYEAPHRIVGTLADMGAAFGVGRPACVARELTKRFEEHLRGSLGELSAHFEAQAPRGELVIVVGGAPEPEGQLDDEAWRDDLAQELAAGTRPSEAARAIAARLGVPRSRVYEEAMRLKASAAGT